MQPLPLLKLSIRKKLYLLHFGIVFFLFINSSAQPTISFNQIAGGFTAPLEIKNADDGSGRIFIAEQGGLVKIYKNGKILKKPFLDLRSQMGVDQFQGIWSIAFSPNYSSNRNFYVLYTDKRGTTALARYQVSANNADSAVANSAVVLLSYTVSGAGHYGDLQFGPDGYLYVSLGAGGNNKFSQNGNSDFGKILRINVDINTAPYYSIPTDNPFVNDPNILNEIWAIGLRNAWRYSFDKSNNDMWIPDVGQDSVEEVNYIKPAQSLTGSNFGWQCYEGNETFKLNGCLSKDNYVFPIFEYHHDISKGGECIIGGYVYRGTAYPSLNGYYICVDYVSANAWKIKSNGSGGWSVYFQKTGIPKGIASFGEGEDGELYAVSQSLGTFYKVGANALFSSNAFDETIAGTKKDLKSLIYPTIVNNSRIMLDLKESYNTVRIINMSGTKVFEQNISNFTGSMSLELPKLNAGMYVVELLGRKILQQKIYVNN
ncbi:MAG: PQQ-dependent sugar dehydrogenase [Panacibacter sp.]